jgi:hypothetical protein
VPAYIHISARTCIHHPAHLKRRTDPSHRAVDELTHPFLFLTLLSAEDTRGTDVAPHTRARGQEERLGELALARERAVHPREHVARVPERVVCVELDRPDGRAARRERRPAERV